MLVGRRRGGCLGENRGGRRRFFYVYGIRYS